MFVFGLLFGPAIGLGLSLLAVDDSHRRLIIGVVALLVLLFIVFTGFFALELKLGLIFGLLLGLLLGATPSRAPEESVS